MIASLLNNKNLTAYLETTGTAAAPDPATGYITLSTATHYIPLPMAHEGDTQSVAIVTDATIAGTFTVEGCNAPLTKGTPGALDVNDYEATGTNWVQINTATAGWAQASGTGWTPTVLSLVKTAGAGGALINLIAVGAARLRVKAVITTGGTVRLNAHGKF